jgi:capsule polysaccharide export protein KpsE/RkpR
MNYFLTQYFVNKIKRNKMNEVNINGKRYDEKMVDKIADEMVMREKYMVSQHNEKAVDEWSKRVTNTLERIESKVDKLVDALANAKSKSVVPRVYK